MNLKYCVDYEEITRQSDDPIDRRHNISRIEGVRIHSISFSRLAEFLLDTSRCDSEGLRIASSVLKPIRPFIDYAVERVLRHSSVGSPSEETWCADWGPGYYGDEVRTVRLTDKVRDRVAGALHSILTGMTPQACVLGALKAEYGYLLAGLERRTWTIEMLPTKRVNLPRRCTEFVRMNPQTVEEYRAYDGIIGVVLDNTGEIDLIDGQHRHQALVTRGKRRGKYIVGRLP